MSVNLVNNETGKVFDILPDRRKHYLRQYFLSYSKEVREKVEFITTDMYETYIELGKELFPNATIILDKFHLVQLLTRNIKKFKIKSITKGKNTRI
ncbi:Transposase [Asaccharospora irregularis DSM 2635]|uniref:Transposase n=2 Tax=Asaccharospora TaxID=1505660 RepID=A0A1M5PPA5_9FIRM|nr:Transposase [Asaccharospora irregularis DSM 2635]